MLLSDKKIKEYVRSGKIVIDPFDEKLVGPASIDVRLGFRFRVFQPRSLECIDPKTFKDEITDRQEYHDEIIYQYKYSDLVVIKNKDRPFVIHPGEFVLASIYEYIKLPDNIAAQIHGRSSIARLGLIVHTSAGWIDPGYEGHLTLEIVNLGKVAVKLYPLMPVAQLMFFELPDSVEIPYNKRERSKYVKEEGATESKIQKDFTE